jgi:hypothetical protein
VSGRDGRAGGEDLSPYDRVTVSLWRRSHAELARAGGPPGTLCLAQAALHAVLARLRHCPDVAALFARYETSAAEREDFALIASLLPADPADRECALLRRVREAGFHLRWLEMGGEA